MVIWTNLFALTRKPNTNLFSDLGFDFLCFCFCFCFCALSNLPSPKLCTQSKKQRERDIERVSSGYFCKMQLPFSFCFFVSYGFLIWLLFLITLFMLSPTPPLSEIKLWVLSISDQISRVFSDLSVHVINVSNSLLRIRN
jgi:hypothetical protein